MPNRIIKESLCESERISVLTDFEFRLWIGLILQADDAGRGDARPAIIKGRVFPLRERVTSRDVLCALNALAAAGCVTLYTVGGRPYYAFPSWTAHQRIRDCKPKYPAPDEGEPMTDCGNSPQLAATRGSSPQIAADCGLNTIQSESNTNPNTKGTRTRTEKRRYGRYDNVLLSDADLKALQEEFPDWEQRVERLSEYMASKGVAYKDHLATIRSWARKDMGGSKTGRIGQSERQVDADEAAAIARLMEV